jgi:hypothetical protein
MPLRDRDGKRLSGSAQRKRAADGPPPMGRAARAAFVKIGAPPLDELGEILGWGRRVLATTAWLVATDELDSTRARTLKDAVFALGSTHNRTELEARMKRLEDALRDRHARNGVVKVVEGDAAKALWAKRSPTARGMSPPGPRAIPKDALPPDDEPKPTDDGGDTA